MGIEKKSANANNEARFGIIFYNFQNILYQTIVLLLSPKWHLEKREQIRPSLPHRKKLPQNQNQQKKIFDLQRGWQAKMLSHRQ